MWIWLLAIIVIIIIYWYASGELEGQLPILADSAPIPEKKAVKPRSSVEERELQKMILERRMITDGISASECNTCSGEVPFATHEFGLPGVGFTEWAMYQTLDPRIVASNKQFVADRLGNPQTWTGATYSPDRHDTYDAVPWLGLSRPARVPVGSPDQIPDIDTGRNPAQKKFKWDSAETE